jgi:predicted nucleic acid-binding protein
VSGTFLDTSALYAAARPEDSDHDRCAADYRQLLGTPGALVTTELIVAELHALALARVGPERALKLCRSLGASARVEILPVDELLRSRAVDLLATRPGRTYSLADAVSFVVMGDRGIQSAFTLDGDFAAEGYRLLPIA